MGNGGSDFAGKEKAHKLVASCAGIFDCPLLVEIAKCEVSPKQADEHILRKGWSTGLARRVRDAVRLKDQHPVLWEGLVESSSATGHAAHYAFERRKNEVVDGLIAVPYMVSTGFNMGGELVERGKTPLLARQFIFESTTLGKLATTVGRHHPGVDLSKDTSPWRVDLAYPVGSPPVLTFTNTVYEISTTTAFELVGAWAMPDFIKTIEIKERPDAEGCQASVLIKLKQDFGELRNRRINMVGAHVVGKLELRYAFRRNGVCVEMAANYWIREIEDGFVLFLNSHWAELISVRNEPSISDKRKIAQSLSAFTAEVMPAITETFKAVIARAPLGPEELCAQDTPPLPLEAIVGESFLAHPPARLVDLFVAQ